MKFLNDEYTLNIDQLGDKNQIDKIRELILKAPTPFSIGISGRWGSGKSSIMKYLMASLGGEPLKHRLNFQEKTIEKKDAFEEVFNTFYSEKDGKIFKSKNIHTIWFNPWENENHEEPMVGLLHTITHHFSFFESTLKEGKKLASVTVQAGLDMLGSLLKLGRGTGTNVKNIGEKYEYDNFEYLDRNQKFKFIFQEAIELLLQQGMEIIDKDARIIIFIDDLDRCEDETIAKLLKEIKQYLSTKRCIFVFGYDRHHIEKSLSNLGTKTSKETRAYLEKLFQATFYVKEPKSEDLGVFIRKEIEKYPFLNPETQEKNLETITSFIASIIDPNPRRVKSYLTAFYFHVSSSSSYGNKLSINIEELKKLALIAYLKLFYESVYSVLENQPTILRDLFTIFNERSVFEVANQKQYFLHLEFKSHIQDIDVTEYNGNKIEHTKDYEEKFLSEVYEMQGKHKSFEQFMLAFNNVFEKETKIEKYL